jgi:hypothetical protein
MKIKSILIMVLLFGWYMSFAQGVPVKDSSSVNRDSINGALLQQKDAEKDKRAEEKSLGLIIKVFNANLPYLPVEIIPAITRKFLHI